MLVLVLVPPCMHPQINAISTDFLALSHVTRLALSLNQGVRLPPPPAAADVDGASSLPPPPRRATPTRTPASCLREHAYSRGTAVGMQA